MANIIPLPQNQGINVPPNSGPTYGLANSIDALFDSYQRAKVQNALLPGQVQSQDLANQGAQQQLLTQGNEYAAGHYGYSPAQISQGFQQQGSYAPPVPPVDGGPQSLYAAPTQAAPQGPSVNQPSPAPQQGQAPQMAPGQPTMPQAGPQAQSGPFGHKSPQEAAQALMQFAQAGQQIGAATAMAGASKAKSEARIKASIANGLESGTGAQTQKIDGVDYILKVDPNSGAKSYEEIPNRVQPLENSIREENEKESAPFLDMKNSYSNLIASAKNPSAAGDVGVMFNFIKMQHPNALVREGQIATAQEAVGVPDRLLNLYNKTVNGQRLADSQRADFVNAGKTLFQSGTALQDQRNQRYSRIVQNAGGNPANIVIPTNVPDANIPMQRMGKLPGSSQSVMLVSNDGGKNWSPK